MEIPRKAQKFSGVEDRVKRLSPKKLTQLFRKALLIRRVEEAAAQMTGVEVAGVGHYYFGQEVTAVAACASLRPDDWVFTTHRNRGHVLARGADPARVIGELLGKENGYTRGKGGNLHIAAPELNIPVASAMVGGNMPVAVGAALGAKLDGSDRVVLDFLGEGTLAEGIFYESVNLSVLWQVPVIFLCENNSGTPHDLRRSGLVISDLPGHVATFNITAMSVDGSDLEAVWAVVAEAVRRARVEMSPSFIEARVPRAPLGQSITPGFPFDPLHIAEAWQPSLPNPRLEWHNIDPLLKLARNLAERGILTPSELLALDEEVQAEVERAVAIARSAPFPPPEAALTDVYA